MSSLLSYHMIRTRLVGCSRNSPPNFWPRNCIILEIGESRFVILISNCSKTKRFEMGRNQVEKNDSAPKLRYSKCLINFQISMRSLNFSCIMRLLFFALAEVAASANMNRDAEHDESLVQNMWSKKWNQNCNEWNSVSAAEVIDLEDCFQ